MMAEATEIAGLGQNGEGNDGADPWNLPQALIVLALGQELVGHGLDLIALADQAARLGDDKPEHADGGAWSGMGRPMEVLAVS